MDPARKRKIRLIVALSAAVLLASALVYTSFSAATEASTPSQLMRGGVSPNRSVELTGKVAAGSVKESGDTLRFAVRDRSGKGPAVPVVYTGVVPDPFRVGREVIVTGRLKDGTFVGERDSLVTKCPSKFQAKPGSSQT
ncbi:MAG TPA: cytochrome c maturation protein CcmE [Thermoleophilaceae bacterium]|nr:cytochrome c maturation protein CcmE [Thermoleophilaceae bacterium]